LFPELVYLNGISPTKRKWLSCSSFMCYFLFGVP